MTEQEKNLPSYCGVLYSFIV